MLKGRSCTHYSVHTLRATAHALVKHLTDLHMRRFGTLREPSS
jgi:hypothetical protein